MKRKKQRYDHKAKAMLCQTFFFKIFIGPRPILLEPLIAPVLNFVCPSSQVSNSEWISHLHTFMLWCGDPEGHVWRDTCLFMQLRCTLYKHVYGMAAEPFDPHTCSFQMYPQALVEPGPGLEPTTYYVKQLPCSHLFGEQTTIYFDSRRSLR